MNQLTSEGASINVHIHGTVSAIRAAAAELAGVSPVPVLSLSGFSFEALLAELRQRAAKDGNVVQIVKFESGEPAGPTPTEPTKNKPGRPRKPAATAPAAPAAPEPPKPIEPGTQQPAASAAPETTVQAPATATAPAAPESGGSEWGDDDKSTEVTLDDVKASLNAYSAVHGQATTRKVMEEKGGALRLADIKPEKYGELVRALKVQAAA